jgi:sensor histidine kinase YesM
VDETIDLKSIQVPALIIQPFIENAIWHGIMPLEKGGHIRVAVEKNDSVINCIIDDNGIGRKNAVTNAFQTQPYNHQSRGVKLTQSRLDLDNALNHRNASVSIIDKCNNKNEPLGTTVILTFKE